MTAEFFAIGLGLIPHFNFRSESEQAEAHEPAWASDYDNSLSWSRANAVTDVDVVNAAFLDWRAIRTQAAAQDYLLTLFLPKPPRAVSAAK